MERGEGEESRSGQGRRWEGTKREVETLVKAVPAAIIASEIA